MINAQAAEKAKAPLTSFTYDEEVTENDVDFTMYYYTKNVGTPSVDKGFPTVMDSVLVKYSGQRIINTESLSTPFDKNNGVWFTLNGVVRGWAHGFQKFRPNM